MYPMAEKTFKITLKVAHDEDLSDLRATDAVLEALVDGIEGLIFPVFARSKNDDEFEISVVDLEIY
jgi:hypothetical protein